jgi:hypothetical protein
MLIRGLIGATALLAAAGCASSSDVGAAAVAEQAGDQEKTCREILTPGSNVVQTVCDTAEGWREYERARTREAQELTRRIQGFGG